MIIDDEKKMKLITLLGEANKLLEEESTISDNRRRGDFDGTNDITIDSPEDFTTGSAKCVNISINSTINNARRSVVNLNISINNTINSKTM